MARILRSSLSLLLLLLAAAIAVALIPSASAGGGGGHHLGWIPGGGSACGGTIGECIAGEEFDLGSESSRRILARTTYISYGSLQRDTVPCNRRGASYYNCRPGAQANPYRRGCSAITRCRS